MLFSFCSLFEQSLISYFWQLAYGVSKTALNKLSIGFATDFAHRGVPVRVNVVHPGAFPSEKIPPEALENLDTPFPGFVAPLPAKRAGTLVGLYWIFESAG